MSDALAALRAGAVAILDAQGQAALASLVRAARVELCGSGEAWTMGARLVVAHRVALVVEAGAFTALTGDAAKLGVVKAAFAQAMRTADTELCDLHVELALPAVGQSWRSAYRDAPARPADRPEPEAMLAGAAALLRALGEREAAEMLGRARLEMAVVPSEESVVVRVVVRLAAEDRARTWLGPALERRIERAVRDAALRAGEQVVVEIGAAV
jgi:hypothetical protein